MRATWSVAACLALAACRSAPPATPSAPPADVGPGVVYQVFVRSFADSDGDGHGDLRGALQHLDHLNDGKPGGTDLGVDALWLMPIHPSPSYHGYDVTDFLGVEPRYGTLADLRALVDACHARGVQVLMDLVLNHVSARHPYFVEASADPASPRRAYFTWRADDPGWRAPWPGGGPTWHRAGNAYFYGLFWAGMPDLAYGNPTVANEMLGVARTWLERGVDGFRVDAARYLVEGADGTQADHPDTLAFHQRLRTVVERTRPGAWMVAEAWTERDVARRYARPFHRVFDFDLAQGIIAALNGERAAPLSQQLEAARADWPHAATFVSNHDLRRLSDRLFHDEAAIRAAVAVLLTLPGRAFLWQGDEVGQRQSSAEGDEGQRAPMAWTAAGGFTAGTPWSAHAAGGGNVEEQVTRGDSLLAWHRQLIALRGREPALRQDAPISSWTNPHPAVVGWVRGTGDQRVQVFLNAGLEPVPLEASWGGGGDVLLGSSTAELAPREVRVLRLRGGTRR